MHELKNRTAFYLPCYGDTRTVPFNSATEYDVLRKAVKGYIEVVKLFIPKGLYHTERQILSLWCNEEGKLNGLAVNSRACRLVRSYSRLRSDDNLHGNVIITGGVDDTGDSLGLTEEDLAMLKAFCGMTL